MDSRTRWIDHPEGLARELAGPVAGPVAVDCEADSLHHYPEKVCLIQLSIDTRDLLIDPLAGHDLALLGALLADAQRRKIFHAADYDLRVLGRDFGFGVRGLFDTMVAARLVGESALGLAALLDKHLGVALDKRFQRADWSQRPLSDEMRAYAAADTRYLVPLAELLEQRLRDQGRESWAAEEFSRLEQVRWRERTREEALMRVKGSRTLLPRGLAVLAEVHALREERARRLDRPPFKILPDRALLGLARQRPERVEELGELDGLPPSWRTGGRARSLVDAVRKGLDTPDAELPERADETRRRRVFPGLKKLAERRDRVAGELDLDPSILAARRLLEGLLERVERGEDPAAHPDLRRWQADLLLPLLSGS